MLRKVFVLLLCVFVFLPLLDSCGSPVNSPIQDTWKSEEKSGSQDQADQTSDLDQPDPDDPDDAENPDNPSNENKDEEDPDDENDSDIGDDQDSVDSPETGDQPDSSDSPGSGDAPDTGDGQGSVGDPETGDQPGSGDSPGSGDAPDTGDGQGSVGDPETGAEDKTVVTGSAALKEYLDGQEENTAANPYPVKVEGINLAGIGAGNALKGFYHALSRYVALDLSNSYGGEFANVTAKTALNKDKITAIILPPGLTTIATNAFAGCAELVFADLSEAVTLMQGSFSGCAKLETLVMDKARELKNTTADGNGAFYKCDSLVSVSLPQVVEIGKKTFNSCKSLSTVYAPRAAVIGDNAFANCKQLERLTLGETPPELGESVFAANKPEVIYVPSSSVAAYKNTNAKGWTDDLKAKVQAIP